jgi:uncharacterized cupin superfamily protein
MTIIRNGTAWTDIGTPHPLLGNYTAQLISDTGGLTQFGAFTETLPPGGKSAFKHGHATEDEMVYILDGTATVFEGDCAHQLTTGDKATFKAGTQVGHCVQNNSAAPLIYLVIGTRNTADVVTYPDHERVLHFSRDPVARRYTTIAGDPADNPDPFAE